MSTSHGTGQPIYFKCQKCRSSLRFNHHSRGNGMNIEVTGKTKPLSRAQSGNGGHRVAGFQVEYRCLDCKHVGWSRHTDAARKLRRLVVTLVDREGPTIEKNSRALIRITRETESDWFGILVDERGVMRLETEGQYPKFAWRILDAAP